MPPSRLLSLAPDSCVLLIFKLWLDGRHSMDSDKNQCARERASAAMGGDNSHCVLGGWSGDVAAGHRSQVTMAIKQLYECFGDHCTLPASGGSTASARKVPPERLLQLEQKVFLKQPLANGIQTAKG